MRLYSEYITYYNWANASIAKNMVNLYNRLFIGGLEYPLFDYYKVNIELQGLTQALGNYISIGLQDPNADIIINRINTLTQ